MTHDNPRPGSRRLGPLARRLRPLGAALALAAAQLVAGSPVSAAEPAAVDLGSAATFAVLAGPAGITNSGSTTIEGDLGIDGAGSLTGFPPGRVDGSLDVADVAASAAAGDARRAYDDAARRTVTAAVPGGALGGTTVVAGVYRAASGTLKLSGSLTLDGRNDPAAVWIFQEGSNLVTAPSSSMILMNGAQSCNVFWVVAGSVSLGGDSSFAGNVVAAGSVAIGSRLTLQGRVLAQGGLSLMNDAIAYPTCSVPDSGAPTAAGLSSAAGGSTSGGLAVTTVLGLGQGAAPAAAAFIPLPLLTLAGLGSLAIAGTASVGRRVLRLRRPGSPAALRHARVAEFSRRRRTSPPAAGGSWRSTAARSSGPFARSRAIR